MILETMIGLDYRASRWSLEQLVIDIAQNHLPSDSKGTIIRLEYLKRNKWTELSDTIPFFGVDALRIVDDGVGYDWDCLNYLGSEKTGDSTSAGQFGDGLKMAACASLREGVDIEYFSQDWCAKPFVKKEGKRKRLCFEINQVPKITGSMTVFHKPSSKLKSEFEGILEKILLFNKDYEIIFNQEGLGYSQKILDHKNGKKSLFIKGIEFGKINYSDYKGVFSYDIASNEIDPDRRYISSYSVGNDIYSILLACEDDSVLRRILRNCSKDPSTSFIECEALNYSEYTKYELRPEGRLGKRLLRAFYEEFGDDTVLSTNVNSDSDAMILGYTVLQFQKELNKTLKKIGAITSSELINGKTKFEWIPLKKLTKEELSAYTKITDIPKWLGYEGNINIIPYETAYVEHKGPAGYIRKDITEQIGVHILNSRTRWEQIGFRKDLLSNDVDGLEKLASTIIHELGHAISGNDDYDRGFADFFVNKLAKKYVEEKK